MAEVQSSARIPSLLAAIGVGGASRAVAVSGCADAENRVPATEEVSYRIGSITKTFTAASTVLLADSGEVGLDDRVQRYLPGTPFGHVSLRMLLSHTSGLQREAPTDMWESMLGPSPAALRERFSRVEFVAEPGQRWHYSNLGYAILGQVIEAVAGRPFESVIDETLLRPLGMDRTCWTQPEKAALGYRLDPFVATVHREPVMDQGAIGAGGQLWSTAGDLLCWAHALGGNEPSVLPETVVEKMHTLHVMVDTSGWTRGWGLGLILERRDGVIISGHTGAMPGFQSALALDRASGLSVAVLANTTRGIEPGDLAAEILCEAIVEHPAPPPPQWWLAECPPHIEPLLGSWWSEADETLFRWESDGLHACLARKPAMTDTRFVEEGPGRFRAVAGRLLGELLLVADTPNGPEIYWATYPFTRSAR
ncbi:beta-lactamase family protein [Nocardia higoensis]|uniref:Beta-lactamase family protein n=1 Tax=Nocardia higoensis TaxID=228599 RepID=A0ABS0DFQ6_9NOCA|nr:serine hydrolase domain-containing protein [Nocardia higoensis]MBF6357308.1 beta-lactamase family protein [Nocardia higoensis]